MEFKTIEAVKNAIDRYISDNEEMFGYMDLKMYDAFYSAGKYAEKYGFTYEEANDIFYNWCEFMYDCFKEDLDMVHDIYFDDYVFRLGRTSSFYLHDQNMIDLTYSIDRNVIAVIDCMICENYSSYYTFYDINSEDVDGETREELKAYILNDLYSDFMEWCKPIKIIYDTIQGYKNGQEENFLYELEFRKCEREEDEEAERKQTEEYAKRFKADRPLTAREEALETVDKLLRAGKKIQLELDRSGDVKLLEITTKVLTD